MLNLIAQIDFPKIYNEVKGGAADPAKAAIFLPGGAGNISLIINAVIPYLFVIAGLILLFMLIMGGIGMMLGANNEAGLKKAQGQITNALLGFLVLFISYWLVQIIEVVLGITIF